MNIFKRKTACILLIACMLLTLFGCGKSDKDKDDSDKKGSGGITESVNPNATDQEKFVGTWTATIDATDLLNESILEGMGEDAEAMAEYVHISSFVLVMEFSFRDDGTYSMSVDRAHFNNTINSVKNELTNGMRRFLEDMLTAEGVDMSLDELLAEEGVSFDELMDESFPTSMFDSLADGFSSSGKWKAENGKLYTSEGANAEIDDNEYDFYEFISSNEIKLSSPAGAADPTGLYPITLKKS